MEFILSCMIYVFIYYKWGDSDGSDEAETDLAVHQLTWGYFPPVCLDWRQIRVD